jgi:hypothetical protein
VGTPSRFGSGAYRGHDRHALARRQRPTVVTDCPYCGCEVEGHDPVTVSEGTGADRDPVGRFCNYGCLAAHVEREGLARGTACHVDL